VSARIINGTEIARQIRQELKQEIAELKEKYNLIPGLAKKAGLQIGTTRAIQVDRYMRTTDFNIFACAGLTEKKAREEGFDVVIGESTAPNRHPGGMPGAVTTKAKLIFSKDNGLLLGGGISGAYQLVNAAELAVKALK